MTTDRFSDALIKDTCDSLRDELTAFLDRLVRFESLPGQEGPAMHWVHEQFEGLADIVELVPISDDIVNDPEYQFTLPGARPYSERPNVRVVLKGDGSGRSVVFNAHVDVVPPSDGQERPFDPFIEGGCLFGRGSVDDKGQVAVMFGFLKAMKQLGLRPRGDVILHIVIEEETGGNGTLALARRGEKADCCVNLETSEGNVFTSLRGAVWFDATFWGRPGHSGMPGSSVNAIDMAIEAVAIIRAYHAELLEKTRHDDPMFAGHPNPMTLTFGELKGGDYPSMAARKAVLRGVFGQLTTPKEEVCREIEERIRTRGAKWLADPENFQIRFPYRHDMSRTDPNLPFVQTMLESWRAYGIDSRLGAKSASSDACFYTNMLGIPTLFTGGGNSTEPHTAHENINLDRLCLEAAVMVRFIRDWCGTDERSG